ncbi:hypothetical protein BEI_3037 [Halomonas beimenensis]|uniref:Uncharacterized protein n=1 Tax=Halomonas beimenensis TaxID=475662 RepID=A0A291PAU8_9GAMM|nr:hypothetical protein BEI_3037 [Halomonas beimenensis]
MVAPAATGAILLKTVLAPKRVHFKDFIVYTFIDTLMRQVSSVQQGDRS